MKKLIFFLIIGLISIQCQQKENEAITTPSEIIEEKDSAKDISGCYLSVFNNDTLRLKLQQVDNRISGIYIRNYYEKDETIGKINGTISHDTIFAEYLFAAEGFASTDEVAFLIKENKIYRGYGPMEPSAKQNGMVLKDHDSIKFDTQSVLNPVDCNDSFIKKHENDFIEKNLNR